MSVREQKCRYLHRIIIFTCRHVAKTHEHSSSAHNMSFASYGVILCRISHSCTPASYKVGHIRRSAVPPAHRRARLGAHDARPPRAGGLRPPQRAHELRDGGAASTLLCGMEPRERLGRSLLRLLLAAGRAAQQAQPLRVEDASCAQGDQRRSPHRSQVHSVGGEEGG